MIGRIFGWGKEDRIIVVGDIHGDLNQLIYPLIYFMKNFKKCKKIIYLGDYIDRGESNVYIYEIINILINTHELKNKIIFLRGNHESYDSGVYDYMNINVDELNESNSFIKTFMFDKFYNLDLDIIHYDEEKQILFSHSPISRNFNDVIKLNDKKNDKDVIIENTYTNERENKNMTYRNIHGHDHTMSSNIDIKKFMNGDKKMISIDGDASYGIRLVQNAYKKTSRWTENISSNVKYLIIHDDNKYNVIEEVINYHSDADFNTKSFDYIKRFLIDQSKKIPILHNRFSLLNLNESLDKFKDSYIKIFKDDPEMKHLLINIRKLYDTNTRKRKSMNIYFHDVPIEIYQAFGLFQFMNFIPIYKLYWLNVLNFSSKIDDIDRRYKIEENINNFEHMNRKVRQFFILIITVITTVVIISTLSYYITKKYTINKRSLREKK